jgi:hypothetical protein
MASPPRDGAIRGVRCQSFETSRLASVHAGALLGKVEMILDGSAQGSADPLFQRAGGEPPSATLSATY